jgi:hypothetical protein
MRQNAGSYSQYQSYTYLLPRQRPDSDVVYSFYDKPYTMRPIPPEKKAWMIEHQKDDRRPLLIGILTTLLFLTYVALGLRILSRKKANAKFGADDIFAFIAGVCIYLLQLHRRLLLTVL